MNETQVRIKINKLLKEAGWRLINAHEEKIRKIVKRIWEGSG